VLLHGIGANGAVWEPMKPVLEVEWPGRWLIVDLRGHGRSSHRTPYGIGNHAADVAALLKQDEEVIILGHSLGGIIALALASQMFGVTVQRAIAFSVKPDWTEDDRIKGDALARTPSRPFDTREQAIDRYLRVAGLKGLVHPGSAAAATGIVEVDGKFRLAADPKVFSFGRPNLDSIARAVCAPVHLLCGDNDSMTSPQAMRRLGGDVTTLRSLGHNVHVEAPRALWNAIADHLGR
jgi:pimeloyl-ACP methyl ester carboxylesterase